MKKVKQGKGNYGETDPTETPRKEHLFGQEIKVYSNDQTDNFNYKNWFEFNGKLFLWKKDTHSRVPRNPYQPMDNKTVETKTWEEFLIAIGIMFYGATYNEEKHIFIDNPELKARNTVNLIQQRARNLTGVSVARNKDYPLGYGNLLLQKTINVIKAFDLYRGSDWKDEDFDPSSVVSEHAKAKLERDDFRDSPVIKEWRENMRTKAGTSELKRGINIDNLYRFMVITGHTSHPRFITDDYASLTVPDKTVALSRELEKYRHWAMTRKTPASWYKEARDVGWEVPDEPPSLQEGEHLELEVYADDVKGYLDDWDRKVTSKSRWKEGKSGLTGTKVVADALANFVQYSGGDHTWSIPDPQPIDSVLSRRVPSPEKASIGQALTDPMVMAGMKFLETGKKHIWQDSPTETRTVVDKETGDKHKIPVRELILDETDKDPHYNTDLEVYDAWGSPYGRLAPANMFFRLALSGCGWRKSEALTCKNLKISKETAKDKKSGFYFKNKKLNVVFQTRKTERLGEKWKQHTSMIPNQSSALIDSRHTIELVLEKNNLEKLKEGSFELVRLDDEERKKNREAEEFGYRKNKKFSREAGQISKTMIGLDNQFIDVNFIEAKTGAKLIGKWNNLAINAYLFVPFKEMYALMGGTQVSVKSEGELIADRKEHIEDRWGGVNIPKGKGKAINPATKIFPTDDFRWAKRIGYNPKSKNDVKRFENSGDRKRQDDARWNDPEDYWIKKPLHSIRHVFAQTWLRKSKWNFGLVADLGHWKIIDTLKLHYGDRDSDDLIDQLSGLFSLSDDENESARIKKAIADSMTDEDVENFQEPTETQELSSSEKKLLEGSDDNGETE